MLHLLMVEPGLKNLGFFLVIKVWDQVGLPFHGYAADDWPQKQTTKTQTNKKLMWVFISNSSYFGTALNVRLFIALLTK